MMRGIGSSVCLVISFPIRSFSRLQQSSPLRMKVVKTNLFGLILSQAISHLSQLICLLIIQSATTISNGRIKTKKELFKRNIQSSMICECCGQEKEDVIHALRDCVVAKRIWNYLVPDVFRQLFSSLNIHDWLCFNLGKAGVNEILDDWACFFGITIWKIWLWRNQFIFSHNAPCCTQMVTEI